MLDEQNHHYQHAHVQPLLGSRWREDSGDPDMTLRVIACLGPVVRLRAESGARRGATFLQDARDLGCRYRPVPTDRAHER